MRDILVEHFTSNGSNSRAMVFCEYCEVVRETYAILIQFSPLIKPKYLMGQHTVKQKQQISVNRSKICIKTSKKFFLKFIYRRLKPSKTANVIA